MLKVIFNAAILVTLLVFKLKDYTNHGGNTITTNDPLHQATIGQRAGLSFYDTMMINLIYCNGNYIAKTINNLKAVDYFERFITVIAFGIDSCEGKAAIRCENGGYQDPNDCTKCLCPEGLGGIYCQSVQDSQGGRLYTGKLLQ